MWIDGETIRTGGAGSMTCGIGPGGAGCFGFGTWGNDSNYEATIWDFTDQEEVGRMSTQASGQSYMPAVVVPIPIIAPVQGTACDGLGDQLLEFFSAKYYGEACMSKGSSLPPAAPGRPAAHRCSRLRHQPGHRRNRYRADVGEQGNQDRPRSPRKDDGAAAPPTRTSSCRPTSTGSARIWPRTATARTSSTPSPSSTTRTSTPLPCRAATSTSTAA